MLGYRIVMAFAAPLLIGVTLWQRLRGRVGARALAERLGCSAAGGGGPTVWLHGASNGEVTSARGVVQRLLAQRAGLTVLITANTGTAVDMVRGWAMPNVHAALSPLDSLGAAGRVVRRWRPGLLIVVENELWPARLAAARAAGVPVALIGARMSVRSARAWARVAPGLLRRALAGLAFASAQDDGSGQRLLALGLPPERLGASVMLKAQVAVVQAAPGPVPRSRVLLAASTHAGEEAMIVAAVAKARGQFDLLILAPRHPRRSAEVAALIAAAGMRYARRSDGAMPSADVPVFLADTMGEMALWYGMAGVTVIGGSFVPVGGHTPFEPAAAGSAIVHGPFMENFGEPSRALAVANGARAVTRTDLAATLSDLDATQQAALAQAARAALTQRDGMQDLVDKLLALIRD